MPKSIFSSSHRKRSVTDHDNTDVVSQQSNQKRYRSSEHTGFAIDVNLQPANKRRATVDHDNVRNHLIEVLYPEDITRIQSYPQIDNRFCQISLSMNRDAQANAYADVLLRQLVNAESLRQVQRQQIIQNEGQASKTSASYVDQHPLQSTEFMLSLNDSQLGNTRNFQEPDSDSRASSVAVNPLLHTILMLTNRASIIPLLGLHESQLRLLYPEIFSEDCTKALFTPPNAASSTVASVTRFLPANMATIAAPSFPQPPSVHPLLRQPYSLELGQSIMQNSRRRKTPSAIMMATMLRSDRPWESIHQAVPTPILRNILDASMNPKDNPKRRPAKKKASEAHQEVAVKTSIIVACPEDQGMLNDHLIFLRKQIEYFQATFSDITSHTRGRSKSIVLDQVGIRCRYCSRIPVGRRRKGSTYFPSTLMGIYQAAQNINVEHLQSGMCSETPEEVTRKLVRTRATKLASSGVGKAYWAYSAHTLGLIDADDGIRFDLTRL